MAQNATAAKFATVHGNYVKQLDSVLSSGNQKSIKNSGDSHMLFWVFMFICCLFTPVTAIIAGRMMWKHPPDEINGIYGYRTKRSKLNKDTWLFANTYCGKLWWKLGFIMPVPTVISFLPFIGSSVKEVGIAGLIVVSVQCALLLATIFFTENAMKKTFTDDGVRR